MTSFQLSAAIASTAVATTVLLGWITSTPALTKILSYSIAMNPMTAVSILMVSAGLLLRAARHGTKVAWLGGMTAFIGISKLGQLMFGLPVGIDELIFADQLVPMGGSPANRMAPNTALALAAIGLGLATSHSLRAPVILLSQCLCVLAAVTASAALVGYALDEVALYQVHEFIAMALSTALVIFASSIAILTTNPNVGLMRIFGDRGPAGTLARIALPLAVLVPVIVSMIGLSGERAGYYGTEAAVAMSLITSVMVNFVLVGGCAVVLYRGDVERQRREAAITESESQYRQAELAGHVGYWKLELPGRAVKCSDGFVRICALPEGADHDLKTVLAVVHPDDSDLVRTSTAQAVELGVDWEFACRIRRPDNSVRYVKSYGVCARNERGETSQVFGVISDVTDLETARRDAEAAKAATASFLANMSHEIRTPMNGMMGFVELLLESDLDAAQRRHLGLVQSSANALLKLLNDILDLSKIEAGRLEIAEAPYSARHGIKECVRLMNPMAEQKGLSLSLSIADDFPTHLLVDGLRLRQILLNLIGNAIKFTHRGSIAVTIAREPGTDGRETMRASVTDSGIGIHPDRTASIFDTFVQAEVTTTRRFGGSGLGLSISRQLAQMMDGTIEVRSVLGKGTTMTLVLPLVVSSAPEAPDSTEYPTAFRKEAVPVEMKSRHSSILLVEDVDINQELFSEMLARLGHQFELASDGAEAVELAKRLEAEPQAWDLILMDLQMPVMDGLTATQAIRAFGGRAATIPIIALTASAFEEERQQCAAVGMNDHLAKPVGIEALRRMINRWGGAADSTAAVSPPERGALFERRVEARLRLSAERLSAIQEEISRTSPDKLKALMTEARNIAHLLAGTAGMVGKEALGDIAFDVETRIAAGIGSKSSAALVGATDAIEDLIVALGARGVPPPLKVRKG
ncbi:hybrid sensor histidine kinase/response regulator [Sphingomonas sp.]|uniref:hybrid sensor histidine kinase/response regulator n=1 Tax=Sphingomonas sp. TaxID=28214 RepID=UPI0017A50EA3|nr:hybrid sensor histidine kinase/response regulator [Sphingomonas sp.]MBA3511542.1 response regulator [Sphingomonas sp.]